ncbi:dicarboxylate/amino acid:cation symporter [Commensalibacter oyaizuii]|uniref:Dicarboxylate/amino acid:cation symporter n=1 Tax=Commensalibacter oyaizuii TaxID=3043873 RepID=A0ABT6Q1R4_9PROT|nr:dicarboxylate/amino acid:cation symporter [Commensalibacter sp. TBRC 16381]MDI2091035.1 dicarboxylate/amino acid:cation symporter [Commensalibacter sp. TBRC 16381]
MAETQTPQDNPKTQNSLLKHTLVIGIAMISGLILGLLCNAYGAQIQITKHSNLIQFITQASDLVVHLFLRLIKMIVAPLVLATLVAGISNVEDTGTIKRIGLKVILWFVAASFVSLAVGMIFANIIKPGVNFTKNLPPTNMAAHSDYHFDVAKFILHIVPDSVMDAMVRNDMLQLVVFAIFFGMALANIPGKSAQLFKDGMDTLGKIMLKITDMVMKIVPLVVFSSLLSIATQNGISIIEKYGLYLIEFYSVVLIMWAILIGTSYLMIGKKTFRLLPFISEPVLVGFATASSESAFPRLLEQLTKFGVSPKISGFVVPLGYSFNLCGTMVFLSFAAIFIAQAYNINMPLDKQIMMLLVMMISSKGIAGVPRASMVMLAAVMPSFDIPEAGLALIIGIDQFLDMARTATSVLGNGLVAAIANEWDLKDQARKQSQETLSS